MDIRRQIGQRIRLARERRGLTQTELAHALGKNATTISNYENGSRTLPITELPKLAQTLHVPIGYFFTFSVTPEASTGVEDILEALVAQDSVINGLQEKQQQYEEQLAVLDERLRQLEAGTVPASVSSTHADFAAARLVTFTVEETTLEQIMQRLGQQLVDLLENDPDLGETR